MSRKLALSDGQLRAITPVIEERQAKLRALRDDGPPGPQRGREMHDIVTAGDQRINALPSPEQQRAYAELERRLIERLHARRGQTP